MDFTYLLLLLLLYNTVIIIVIIINIYIYLIKTAVGKSLNRPRTLPKSNFAGMRHHLFYTLLDASDLVS